MSIIDDRGYNQGFKPSAAVLVRNQRRVDRILQSIQPIAPGHQMLEIGCGTGEYAHLFAQQSGLHVIAADICVPFIEEARRLYHSPNLQFACIDFTDTTAINAQFGDQAFDSVVGNGILHHMYYHIDEVLSKLHALLKPGGRFAFLEPNLYNPYCATIFQIPIARKWARLEPSEMAFSASFIADRLQKAGFDDICVEYRDFLIPGTPTALIQPVIAVGTLLERIPVINMLAQSLSIRARKVTQTNHQGSTYAT
ncbi:MAG: class I SAM-dependent methyltransferase [Chloroflexales bacterium]|nr:class I SAM-dependent methyltransferase [Chloroflexales bacterium]